jgi:hypothetical protein
LCAVLAFEFLSRIVFVQNRSVFAAFCSLQLTPANCMVLYMILRSICTLHGTFPVQNILQRREANLCKLHDVCSILELTSVECVLSLQRSETEIVNCRVPAALQNQKLLFTRYAQHWD